MRGKYLSNPWIFEHLIYPFCNGNGKVPPLPGLRMNGHLSAVASFFPFIKIGLWQGPSIKPFCIFHGHIDTTMTHASTKIVVPVCPMECNACFSKETNPRNPREFIRLDIIGNVALTHVLGRHFYLDIEPACRRIGWYGTISSNTWYARRDQSVKD